jgi:hypothetical protein
LSLFHSLASRRAQVIALHPDPSSPSIQHLVDLLRTTTENERIYADECDINSIKSIKQFVAKWEKEAKSGMVGDLPTRIEAIVFCDGAGNGLERTGLGLGRLSISKEGSIAVNDNDVELYHSSIALARHAMIQLFLPTLLKSASTSPVRIISSISPFYSTGSVSLVDLDYSTRSYPSYQPWVVEGSATLTSILLLRELQTRIDEGGKNRLYIISVCGGFTRNYWRRILRATPGHPHFSWTGCAAYLLALPIIFLFAKSAEETAQGLLATVVGSAKGVEGAVGVESEIVSEDEGKEKTNDRVEKKLYNEDGEEISAPIQLRGGAIYREGKEIRSVD